MNDLIDARLSPWLWRMGLWSLQWSVLIAVLMLLGRANLFRRAATRLLSCWLVLIAGILLPLVPPFWGPTVVPRLLNGRDSSVESAQLGQSETQPDDPRPNRPTDRNQSAPAAAARPVSIPGEMQAVRRTVQSSELMQTPVPIQAGARPRSERMGLYRLAVPLVAVLWFSGVTIQLVRLVSGWNWLARIRRGAAAVGPVEQAEFELCRRQIGLKRDVRIGIHASILVPIFIGGWKPAILVPPGWNEFRSSSRRAIVFHELAHAMRRDDFAKLVEEVIGSFFFFHPLVRWLLARISADREELCDAAVIHQGIAPRELAGVLLECCQAFLHHQPAQMPRGLLLPFFRLPSVKDRIELLMEDQNMSRWTLRPSWRSIAGTLALVGGLFATVGSFGVRADDPRPKIAEQAKPREVQRPPENAAKYTIDLSKNFAIDLSKVLSAEELSNARQKKPVEIKGFGTFKAEELGLSAISKEQWAVMGGEQGWLRGRLVDIQGNPLVVTGSIPVTAGITTLCRGANCILRGNSALADPKAEFPVMPGPEGYEPGRMTPIEVRTASGQFETCFLPVKNQIVDVHLPTHLHPKITPPQDVAEVDLAGLVVDAQGNPLAGVEVALFEGLEGKHRRLTGTNGRFVFKNVAAEFDRGQPKLAEVRFRKPGYSPQRFMDQPIGVRGWVVALGSQTFVEGTVRDPDGKTASGASIRANQGPKQNVAGVFPDLWTETATDASGRYRLYLQPDEYEIVVKSPQGGVARLAKQPILFGEHRTIDIALEPGVTFAAALIDSQTNKPVSNVRLWNWQNPGVEGRSDASGVVTIAAMLPGILELDVEANGYVRWWSENAKSEWSRKQIDNPKLSWQRNFDRLDFDLQRGMKPVTIVVERGARLRGRVVDPNGKSVSGATVAPALTGSGNSLTGDTRFSVETKADGTFDMLLPASHRAKYNLIAHDGKYQEWRAWANGVLPPIQTTPGQTIEGMELKLTRPAVIRGRLVDLQGQAIADCALGANATDKMDNRYYTPPTAATNAQGQFEIRFLRPGNYEIETQWMPTADGLMTRRWEAHKHPPLTVREGQEINGVEIQAVKLTNK